MKKLVVVFPLLLALAACGIFATPEVEPVVTGVHGMDAKYQELRGGFVKLLTYGQNNGMPQATWQVYMQFIDERTSDFDRTRVATLAALADLGDVTLAEIFAAAEESAPKVKELIDGLKTGKEGQ